jgi:hypothetical protein
MGSAQGLACRAAIEERLARAGLSQRGRMPISLRPFTAGRVLGGGPAREIVRHYPHLCERTQGIARGSGRSVDDLLALLLANTDGNLPDDVLGMPSPAVARPGVGNSAGNGAASGALLARPIASPAEFGDTVPETRSTDWIARQSRPEVGFASVELTVPWLATAVAGVNAAGVAALLATSGASSDAGPPVALLVQECLQRFDDVAGCIDWCLKRPAGGSGSIVVGDESGNVAVVEIHGADRRLMPPTAGVLVTGGDTASHDELRRSFEPGAPADAIGAVLGAGVVVHPRERALHVRLSPDGPEERFRVDAQLTDPLTK